MPVDDMLIWIFFLSATLAHAIADRFDLLDLGKKWPRTIWKPITRQNRSAYIACFLLIAVGMTAIMLRIFV